MPLVLNYSQTSNIKPEFTKQEANTITDGWVTDTVIWQEDTIKELLTTTSIAPARFKNGKRVNKAVINYQFIMLDFDDPECLSFKSMKELLLNKFPKFAWCMFTSTSHQTRYIKDGQTIEPHDKYRVIFPLAKGIKEALVDQVKGYFLELFPTMDKSSFMMSRYFYKGNDKEFYFNQGSDYIDVAYLSASFLASQKAKKKKTYINPRTVVTTLSGAEIPIVDIMEKTRVHCPFHEDKTPSAFVDITVAGNLQLFCSACQAQGLGTDEKGNYYLEREDIKSDKIEVVWSLTHHGPTYIKENGDAWHLKQGKEWELFCKLMGMSPSTIDDLKLVNLRYEFGQSYGFKAQDNTFNTFKPSELVKNADKVPHREKKLANFDEFAKIAPYTAQILLNLTGTKELAVFYLNWIGFLVQIPRAPISAILVQGRLGGIGKDLLFKQIWTPLLGIRNCVDTNGAAIGERFNAQLRHARLVRFDECFATNSFSINSARVQWLKNRVGAKTHQIEEKGVDKEPDGLPHYAGYLLHSNSEHALQVEPNDRRFCIMQNDEAIPVPSFKWYVNNTDLEAKLQAELPSIAKYMMYMLVDETMADTPMLTAAKARLQQANEDEVVVFAHALRDRDLDYFDVDDVFDNPRLVPDTLDKLHAKRLTKFAIQEHQAIPASYIDYFLKHKIDGQTSISKKRLLTNRIMHKDDNGNYFRISFEGKQHRVMRYE